MNVVATALGRSPPCCACNAAFAHQGASAPFEADAPGSHEAVVAGNCYHVPPLPVSRIDRAGGRAKQDDTAPATRRAYTRIVLGHVAHHLPDRRLIRSVSGTHVLGVPAYASTVTSPPMLAPCTYTHGTTALALPIVAYVISKKWFALSHHACHQLSPET